MESPLSRHAATPVELQRRLAVERRGVPFLVFRGPEGDERLHELAPDADRVTIGRRPEADVALPWDTGVSRLHAVLERVAGEWTVVDDGLSRNGTYLGAERLVGRRRLCDGDVIRAGRTLLAYRKPTGGDLGATSLGDDLGGILHVSPAQRRVLVALARPHLERGDYATPASNQDIADELFLSVDAVKTHLRALFVKFGIEQLPQNRKRMALVERGIRTGLVTERDVRGEA
jgi:pSer/pThr/pTyr-binding forkhead associated (FHA) protein